MKFRLVSVVWGEWHRETFLTLNLPSLLAPENLPDFVRRFDVAYDVYTTTQDARIIRAAGAFQRINDLMPVQMIDIGETGGSVHGVASDVHNRYWSEALNAAKDDKAIVVMLAPDMFWSDRAMMDLGDVFESGKAALFKTVVRVCAETFAGEIADRLGPLPAEVLSVQPRDLVGMMFRHLHPMHASHLRGASHTNHHHEHLFWWSAGNGLHVRTFSAHSLAINPGHFDLNEFHAPKSLEKIADVAYTTDSDHVLGASLTPLFDKASWYNDPFEYDSIEIGKWWMRYDNPIHGHLASQRFRFHTGDVGEGTWDRAERAADNAVRQVYFVREMVRVWHAMADRRDCKTAARLLAFALMGRRLHRNWPFRGPFTIFVPTDEAFARIPSDFIDGLLEEKGGKGLIDLMRRHVVTGALDLHRPGRAPEVDDSSTEPSNSGDPIAERRRQVRTVGGQTVDVDTRNRSPTVDGIAITGRIEISSENIVYAIDGVLR